MKLSREELKDISAGVSLSEYGLLTQFIAKVIAAIVNWFNGLSSGGSQPPADGGGGVSGGSGNDVITP